MGAGAEQDLSAPPGSALGGRPRPSSVRVSEQMSRMPRASTAPELALRRELHARGLRFRLHSRHLPGRPDVVFTRARLAVFVDGCFWHCCPEHATFPKANAEWWRTKLQANEDRDRRNDRALEAMGWLPVHAWEHEDPASVGDRVEILWHQRAPRPARGAPT